MGGKRQVPAVFSPGKDFWLLKMGLTACSEMSVRNDHYLLRHNPEHCSSRLLLGGSLKSRIRPGTHYADDCVWICQFMHVSIGLFTVASHLSRPSTLFRLSATDCSVAYIQNYPLYLEVIFCNRERVMPFSIQKICEVITALRRVTVGYPSRTGCYKFIDTSERAPSILQVYPWLRDSEDGSKNFC
jgi:hypothetical protein